MVSSDFRERERDRDRERDREIERERRRGKAWLCAVCGVGRSGRGD